MNKTTAAIAAIAVAGIALAGCTTGTGSATDYQHPMSVPAVSGVAVPAPMPEWTPAPAPLSALDYAESTALLRDLWGDFPQSYRDGWCDQDPQALFDQWGAGDIYHPDAVADFTADVCNA